MAIGAGAAGADMLMQVLEQKLREQALLEQTRHAAARLGLDRDRMAQDDRQFGVTSAQTDRRLGQADADLGFRKERAGVDDQRYAEQAPLRAANVRLHTAQAADIERKPQAEQAARDFTSTRDKTQHSFDLEKIAKQGDQSARVAGIRSETAGLMPVRIATVDEQGNPVTKFVSRQEALGGGGFAAAPTAEQRNKSAASARSAPVLGAISELSERINTQQGAVAKISGAVERAKAQANLSDDVAEYEAVVSGFTPMLARAVGHTGVLTEQDVQSVRKMLPQPGDSKSVRDRKIARINSLMGAVSGPAGNQQTGGGDDSKARAADLLKKYGGG